jgi:hypothetical protein
LDLPTADWSIEFIPDGTRTMTARFYGYEAKTMSDAISDLDLQNQVTILHETYGKFEMRMKSWTYNKVLYGYDELFVVWDLVESYA